MKFNIVGVIKKIHNTNSFISLFNRFFPLAGFILFLLFSCGFLYSIITPTMGFYPTSSGYSLIIPSMDYQTTIEFVVVFVFIFLASFSLMLISYGSRISMDIKFFSMITSISIILFIFSLTLLQYLLAIKIGWI